MMLGRPSSVGLVVDDEDDGSRMYGEEAGRCCGFGVWFG